MCFKCEPDKMIAYDDYSLCYQHLTKYMVVTGNDNQVYKSNLTILYIESGQDFFYTYGHEQELCY